MGGPSCDEDVDESDTVDTVRDDEPEPVPDGKRGGLLEPFGLNGNGWPRGRHKTPMSNKRKRWDLPSARGMCISRIRARSEA